MTRRFLPAGVALLLLGMAAQAQGPAAPKAAPAQLPSQLMLARYDLPRGLSDGFAPTRRLAVRVEGDDPVDWPAFTLDGNPLWTASAEERVPLTLRRGSEAASPFRAPGDYVIQPGGHWLRAIQGAGNRTYLYTADRAARCGNVGAPEGRYELWTFPLRIEGQGGPVIKLVELRYGGRVIYKKDGPFRSLTVLLPASEPGRPYELSVSGRPPMKFNVGLVPPKLGNPHESAIAFAADLAGDGPKITVSLPARSAAFPHQKEWDADVAGMARAQPERFAFERPTGLARSLGIEVPRSPFTIYAAALPHGMSGGFFKKGAAEDDYAAQLAAIGYDAVFEPVSAIPLPAAAESLEKRAAALARRGIKLGLQYDHNWTRPSLQNPNLPILAHTLPDWHAPLYRSVSLAAQRFARLPNFAGMNIGADLNPYAASWYLGAPLPDRPWGEAMVEFMSNPRPQVPRAPTRDVPQLGFEVPANDTADFVKYVDRYDAAYQQYGYFAEAVREAAPGAIFTTASYSSAPNAARGGWPAGTVPARAMFRGLNTQQAYDWNDRHAARPMQLPALLDRLRSYAPRTRTWGLLDDFRGLYGRESWQRAAALALTRGVQGLGTNFIPTADEAGAAWQAEMNAWIHRYAGVYARTVPEASIGIFFSHQAALLRPVVRGELADPTAGSHEGKVTEALFLCHAAGWPARIVTFQEISAGPLPRSMKALLLVGLDVPDDSWHWARGLEPMLKQFLDSGGRILSDDVSECPLPAKKLAMRVAAYVGQDDVDPTPRLIERNAANIAALRAAMEGVKEPAAVSDDPTVWAIPANCLNTHYITVVNQASAQGDEANTMIRPADPRATKPETWKTKANASLFVRPQTAGLRWNTHRPIYDVRLGRRITVEEAARVDLTKESFQWYALPQAEIVKPEITVEKALNNYYEARATISNPTPLGGIPVEFVVSSGGETVTVFGATGAATRLPLHASNTPGDFTVTARELLSGLSDSTVVKIAPPTAPEESVRGPTIVRDLPALRKFSLPKGMPLTIALTPEQSADAATARSARVLTDHFRKLGRNVSTAILRPGSVVLSLQVSASPHRFPQWRTIASDLVLFGTPNTNVLVLDQLRGQIFPRDFQVPRAGEADVILTRSPFSGECDVLNVIAPDSAGLTAAVGAITSIK